MILRSMLYVPGNNIKLINKALGLSMDAVILDLEDAVPMQMKQEARNNLRQYLGNFKKMGISAFVRVNSFGTGLTNDDLKEVVSKELNGIVLAKTETVGEVKSVDELLTEHEIRLSLEIGRIKVTPLIESARGVMDIYAIARSNTRIEAVAFGAGDYLRDLGLDIESISPDQSELLYARSQIVNSCQAVGVKPIDTPYLLSLRNSELFMNEVDIAYRLGFSGKQCIHPDQIAPINRAFSPSEEKVAYSLRLVEAFEECEKQGLGAVSFEGKMIDRMSYAQAKQLLARMKEISEREGHAKMVMTTEK
jgi:citrate lyase subunit beta/citryl-CoA lyase